MALRSIPYVVVEAGALLAESKGVVCTPMSVFYSTPPERCELVRFTVCKSRAYVERACEALRRGV